MKELTKPYVTMLFSTHTFGAQNDSSAGSIDSLSEDVSATQEWKVGSDEKRILVVDDNKDAADVLSELLSILGYNSTVAYGGHTGCMLYKEGRPRFVFLDIAMPDMNGYEAAQRIRHESNGKTILVAVTGFGQPEDIEKSRKAGFDYHLTKPVDIQRMKDILKQHSS